MTTTLKVEREKVLNDFAHVSTKIKFYRIAKKDGTLILLFFSFFRRYFQGIPENNPSQRHIYSTSDKWGGTQGPPKCITCDLKKEAENCTFNDAIFSPS